MSLAKESNTSITEEEYLNSELISDIKHEYIDGQVYAMAGASTRHNLISKNVLYGLENSLRKNKSSCDIFSSDMKVNINDKTTCFFYPDIMVVCESNSDEDYFQNNPVIIVEVLSKSTRKNDLSTKKLYYFNIPELQEYVVIEQNFCEVEVFRKSDDWKSTVYFLGDEISFDSINVTLSVEDIYYHVKNEDMTSFLKENAEQEEEKN